MNIEINNEGYLKSHNDWNEQVARTIAREENIVLTKAHWEIIYFLRKFYEKNKEAPAIRLLVKELALKFGPEIGNSLYLHRLFPKGPAKQASKIAGLPKPEKCI